MDRKILIAGFNSLESYGIRRLVEDRCTVRVESMWPGAQGAPRPEYDLYIVSADVFVGQVEYFMPRRQKTLVINSRFANAAFDVSGEVSVNSDLSDIEAAIDMRLKLAEDSAVGGAALSQREIEVLRLIAAGKINKEIADQLCISINTVITHRKNLSSKLGVKSASGLSLYAAMHGIV